VTHFKDTLPERLLQELLNKLGIKYRKHEPIIGQPDLFIEPNICIFADGDYWHNRPEAIERDKLVNKELINKGYKVLRFWENEIRSNIDNCANRIKTEVK